MKNLSNILVIFLSAVIIYSCAQTAMKSFAKKIEFNKKEYIGKDLNYLLSKIDVKIQSVIPLPIPNKNPNEVNSISFLFVNYSDYNMNFNKNTHNTKITVKFNQNWELNGKRCVSSIPDCSAWSVTDRKNLGNLKVFDIIVSGKD